MKQIELTKGHFALVDDEDFERINANSWYAQKNMGRGVWYARRRIWHPATKSQTLVAMHREILGLIDPKIIVDHVDMNGLNNTRANLRIVTYSQNQANKAGRPRENSTSNYKGVHWCSTHKNWVASIGAGGGKRKTTIGRFDTETEAARAYDREAAKRYGDCARPNFLS